MERGRDRCNPIELPCQGVLDPGSGTDRDKSGAGIRARSVIFGGSILALFCSGLVVAGGEGCL